MLDDVYNNPDPRAYPLSSYSYMIVPTSTGLPFSAEKGDALGRFIYYFLCDGQQKAEPLGYSPLPKNLVQFAFDAASLIPGAPAPPPIDTCNNPTITGTFITGDAPPPPPTDKKGSGPGTTVPGAGGTTATGGTTPAGVGGDQSAAPGATGTGDVVVPGGVTTGASGAAAIVAQPITVEGQVRNAPTVVSLLVVLVLAVALFLPPLLWSRK